MTNSQREELTLNDKIKFDNKGGAILGVLEGPVADFINPTRNGRLYSEPLWDKVMKNPLVQEQFKNGGIVGELDHPADRDDICSEKIAVIMPEPPVKKDGEYIGKFNILDTPCGRIVYTLAKAGFKLGVSSRGTGEVIETYNGEEVDPDSYDFTCFDVVLLPAVEKARMNLVTEGLKKNDYKKLLKESLDSASKSDKKIMEDTLSHLNINIEDDPVQTCVICGKEFSGYGNNPYPVKDEGVCCDECNWTAVIPARLANIKAMKESLKGHSTEELDKQIAELEAQLDNLGGEYDYFEDHNNPWGSQRVLSEMENIEEEIKDLKQKKLEEDLDDILLSKEETVEEPAVEADIQLEVEPEEKEEEIYCTASDEQILDLLHKFLKKEGFDLDGEGEEEQHFIEIFHETIPNICAESDKDESEDIKTVDPEIAVDAVDDVKVDKEILDQFTNVLEENKDLKESIKQLQSEKAVSSAKVEQLNEDIVRFKSAVANTGKKVLELKEAKAQNDELNNEIKSLNEEIENYKKQIEAKDSEVKALEESFEKEKAENKSRFDEELKNAQTSADSKIKELTAKLESAIKLTENYKKLAHNVANRYIESKAISLGITANEIKNRLNESYTLEDVDKVCDELQNYSLNISKLPFNLDRPSGLKMQIREDKRRDPLKSIDAQYDDTVDDFLLELAGLKNNK